jgi:hypothetical protein
MRALSDADLLTAGGAFDSEELADRLEGGRKKRRYAYLAWLCLGSHYLYLRRPVIQALFWLSLGGLLIWWAVDLLRIPALVEQYNRSAVGKLLKSWQARLDWRLEAARPTAPWPLQRSGYAEEAEEPAPAPEAQPEREYAPRPTGYAAARRNFRPAAAYALVALLLAVLVVPVLAPRPIYPRGAYEPSHRTLRQVNIRATPSTSGAVLDTVPKNILIRGEVVEVADATPSTWLKITRGPQTGRYVAIQNLGRR